MTTKSTRAAKLAVAPTQQAKAAEPAAQNLTQLIAAWKLAEAQAAHAKAFGSDDTEAVNRQAEIERMISATKPKTWVDCKALLEFATERVAAPGYSRIANEVGLLRTVAGSMEDAARRMQIQVIDWELERGKSGGRE
jgi:hypothetical protein